MNWLRRGVGSALFAAILLGPLVGCGSDLPPTYPVTGKVVFKNGKAVNDGRIQFQATFDPELVATGDIAPDGSFSLTTFKRGKQRPGAAEGQHKVTVELERPSRIEPLAETYTVKAQDNAFTIVVPQRKR
jgi:hypothetical protein